MHAAGTFAQPEEWQKNLDYLGDGTQPSGPSPLMPLTSCLRTYVTVHTTPKT